MMVVVEGIGMFWTDCSREDVGLGLTRVYRFRIICLGDYGPNLN